MRLVGGVFLSVFVLSIPSINVLAAMTPVLQPIADGINDSSLWIASNGKQCNTLNCFERVDNLRGNFCGTSDGDATFMESKSQNARQTFRISLAGVPNQSKINRVTVTVCDKKSRKNDTANPFRTSLCVNGVCQNSTKDIIPGVNYVSATQTFDLNLTKGTTTRLEIGAVIIGNKNTLSRISAISAFITYAPPASAMPPTTTSPSPGRSTGGVVPTHALFTGHGYPGGTVDISRHSQTEALYRVSPESTFDINATGTFRFLYKALLQSEYTFSLQAIDINGRRSVPITFKADFVSTDRLIKENLLFPPTVEIRGSQVLGYGAPNATIQISLDGAPAETTRSGPTGYYELSLSALSDGPHQLTARQVYQGTTSTSSPASFFVGTIPTMPIASAINIAPPPASPNPIGNRAVASKPVRTEFIDVPPNIPMPVVEEPKQNTEENNLTANFKFGVGTILVIAVSLGILVVGIIGVRRRI